MRTSGEGAEGGEDGVEGEGGEGGSELFFVPAGLVFRVRVESCGEFRCRQEEGLKAPAEVGSGLPG